MEMSEVETVETHLDNDGDEQKARITVSADEDSINATEHDSDDSSDSIHDEAEMIPIVTQPSGAISFQSSGNQQFTVSVPNQNVTNVKIVKVVPLPHARSEVWSYFGFIADDDGEIQDKKKAICKICASTLAYSGNTTNLFTHLKAMHPEANPQKLAPTNRTPRTGKKLGKRRFVDVGNVFDGGSVSTKKVPVGAISQQPSQQYIVRAIYTNDPAESPTSLFEGESPALVTGNGAITKSAVKTVSVVNENGQASSADGTIPVISHEDITAAIVNILVKDCRPISLTEGKGFEEFVKLFTSILAPGYQIPDSDKLKTLVKKRYDEVRRNLILRAMDEE